jgi:hypothetical protein
VRRSIALLLVVFGLVAVVVGVASGCGTLFSFNGRHPIAVQPVVPGTPLRASFKAKAGMRYTLAVHVVFEREGLSESNGVLLVEAQLPVAASILDASGDPAVKIVGWMNPNEPPTVVYGHAANGNQRRPASIGPAELVAERLVGPYSAAADRDVAYVVDLGVDRIGTARIQETRVVVYDDKLPTSITVAFVGAAAGAVALVIGTIMLFFGLFRARRGGTRKRQIV